MKATVVYHSKHGNCERIARAITGGLSEAGHDVMLLSVDAADTLDTGVDLLVMGSPTRMGKAMGPIRKFIDRQVTGEWRGKRFAAFGTGLQDRGDKVEPKGADDIYGRLESAWLVPIAPAFKATVAGYKGPLLEGEAERALTYGRDLAAALEGKS
jgi:flavodoxin